MSDYPDAIEYLVDSSRVFVGQNSCEVIVIHGTGGNPAQTAQQLGDYFRTNTEVTSVHYGIDRAGVVAQYVREIDGAGGNCCTDPGYDPFWQPYLDTSKNLNLCTISIEHENDLTNSLPLSDAQKLASFKLVAYLSKKYSIAPDHIKSHASIAPINRAHCPGNYPWSELWAYLKGGSTMGVPMGWHDANGVLTAPNNIPVVMGFRDYVLNNNWDANNWPLEPESEHNPVEESNPSLGQGARQTFRWKTLEYTSSRGVFEGWTGQELVFVRAQRDSLQASQKSPVIASAALAVGNVISTLQDVQKQLSS